MKHPQAGGRPAVEPEPRSAAEAGGGAVLPPASQRYFDDVATRVASLEPGGIAQHVMALVDQHDRWRQTRCLNLVAAENTTSAGVLRLMGTYIGTRVTEGFPGDKEWPPRQSEYIDEIEAILVALAKQLFRARYVEWRATSTTMANAVAFWSLTRPGDRILVQSMPGGGNMNYHDRAVPLLRGLVVDAMPAGEYFTIDPDAVREIARRIRPAVLVVGGSKVLFPYPVSELRAIADEVGAAVLYDAAHVGLLIAAGLFQDPLAEGADVLTTGTHKIMSGPIGGLAVTNDAPIAGRMLALTFPAFVQTHNQSQYAATAYALAEMVAHGRDYAVQMVRNAKALGAALSDAGITVLASERGFTQTHQIVVDFGGGEAADRAEELCQRCNILFAKTRLTRDGEGDTLSGARISVQEITRQGMRESEMRQVAALIERAVLGGEASERVARDVEALVQAFGRVQFSFD